MIRVTAAAAALLALAVAPAMGAAQAAYTVADSAIVRRILLAEDARELSAAALAEGVRHRDPMISGLAARARARIADSTFAARDTLLGGRLRATVTWPEPGWKARYRALAGSRDDCAAMQRGLTDAVVAVQVRAAALLRASCATDEAVGATLRAWVDALPMATSTHQRAQASWHLGAHGIVALARLRPDEARQRLPRLASHRQWNVRQYAARAAGLLRDSTTLVALADDRDANVAEAAFDAMRSAKQTPATPLLLRALEREEAQAVRAAAITAGVVGDPALRAAAERALARFTAHAIASERDVRVALLAMLGRPASDDRAPARPAQLGRDAVALALGAERYLEVLMAPEHGGGHFTVRLRGDVAPIMAARVLDLARSGHYNNTSWHRAEYDFVLQGGSAGANEYVGDARFLVDELGTIAHPRGSVGMSTRGHDTGDAQWFINLRDNARLVGDYTVFAEVVEGMDIADAALEGDRIVSIREVRRPAARP